MPTCVQLAGLLPDTMLVRMISAWQHRCLLVAALLVPQHAGVGAHMFRIMCMTTAGLLSCSLTASCRQRLQKATTSHESYRNRSVAASPVCDKIRALHYSPE